ncbi:diaminobutyrate acetyltransferase [Caenispirillum salinarum]|uniref:diaminobutyrate acetyltransferase n=1 Tax=Caenispirillum salinarum TaxID=859058 RepID=UPI00384DCCD2
MSDDDVTYRTPSLEDGAEIWKMVDEAAALDDNSSYAYFMACRNFAATSVVAEVDGEIAGMVTAYPLPQDPTQLFVWQVGVRDKFQGKGIARGMLEHILNSEQCASVRWIETTIAPDNAASEALFSRIAEHFNTEIKETEVYEDEMWPEGEHKVERLFVIGPINRLNNEIHILREDNGYRICARLDGVEQPAFQPENPMFSTLDDALRAADLVRESHNAREVIIVENKDHV